MSKFFLIPKDMVSGAESHLIINIGTCVGITCKWWGVADPKQPSIVFDYGNEQPRVILFGGQESRNEWFNRILFEIFPEIKPKLKAVKKKPAKKSNVVKLKPKAKAKAKKK